MTNLNIVSGVVLREGGFVDNPNDKGGPTNFGITIPTLTEYLGKTATALDIKNLTPTIAKLIYLKLYLEKPGFDKIESEELRDLLVDSAVLHGRGQTVRWLQRAVETNIDGVLGENTLKALKEKSVSYVYNFICAQRLRLVSDLVLRDRSQVIFLKGWLNRIINYLTMLK